MSAAYDDARAIVVDGQENVYVAGSTHGSIPGFNNANPGVTDVVVIKFTKDGNQIWAQQFGTIGGDTATALAIDANGNVYLGG